jgi:hypothetical protein
VEENEILTQNEEAEEIAQAESADIDSLSAPDEAEEAEGAEEESEENEAPISAESFAKTLANPMFAVFARGRGGSIEEAVRSFEEMLMAGRASLSEEELMKMTPGACGALGGTALSENQRRIAREAGMSYREYYEIIRSIPTKTK